MSEYDLMGDPENFLHAEDIRKRADRSVFRNEFAIAYQDPIDPEKYPDVPDVGTRGYLSAWVREGGPGTPYERVQGWSGDDEMIRRWLGEMASQDVGRIEKFIGKEHAVA